VRARAHLQPPTEHGPQHAVLFAQRFQGRAEQCAADIQTHILTAIAGRERMAAGARGHRAIDTRRLVTVLLQTD
jgi:hypothetical protein